MTHSSAGTAGRRYYKCSGAKRKLGCKKKAIRKNWIEDVVVKYTATQVLTDTVISRIADAIVIMQEQEDTVTPVLKQQLQQCETEIRNVMKAIRQGILTDSTRECLEELEQQRDSLRGSIAQLQLERRKFTKKEIVDWVGHLADLAEVGGQGPNEGERQDHWNRSAGDCWSAAAGRRDVIGHGVRQDGPGNCGWYHRYRGAAAADPADKGTQVNCEAAAGKGGRYFAAILEIH